MIHLDRRRIRGMAESAAWLLGRRRRIRIVGDSMLPTLAAGQFVLVDQRRTPVEGELALARHPLEADLLVVKRVASIGLDGTFSLVSDNVEAGTDSRTWGPISPDAIEGTVTLLLDHPSAGL
ncbi:MAG: nickel-type superoxide dismutase maturation protease [Acidimicrobiales bacterium]